MGHVVEGGIGDKPSWWAGGDTLAKPATWARQRDLWDRESLAKCPSIVRVKYRCTLDHLCVDNSTSLLSKVVQIGRHITDASHREMGHILVEPSLVKNIPSQKCFDLGTV